VRDYYDARLAEYDKVYLKPERQVDLMDIRSQVQRRVNGHAVLELACGTGYWTAVASSSAKSIFATDISERALSVAKRRQYFCPIEFAVADALQPDAVPRRDLTMAMFWWSHVQRQDIAGFLLSLAAATNTDGWVLFLDNRYVTGSSTPISRRDEWGNTYQTRKLEDGSSHEVIKNFPNRDDLSSALALVSDTVDFVETTYYWIAQARLRL